MSDDDLADDGHDNHEPVLSQSKREETKQPEPFASKVSKVKASKPVSEVKPEVKASKPEVKAYSKPPVKEKSTEKKELMKIILDRLEKGDNDPKLLELAMQLLGPEKTKPKAVSYL